MTYACCKICPRECGTDRTTETGFCGCGATAVVAKVMLHQWEEPCISGTAGSGAIFFAGCNLRCGYCQNKTVSCTSGGEICDAPGLAVIMSDLEAQGAHNINLVTSAHFLPTVADALVIYKKRGSLPVVYNTSGYEKAFAIKRLDGLVDVWLPDLKYFDDDLAVKYSSASGYNAIAVLAIDEMVRQQPSVVLENGLIKRGVIIRHLVLPGHKRDSALILRQIAERWGSKVKVSLMRQYTPEFAEGGAPSRRVTGYEYNYLLGLCEKLGLDGYFQSAESAVSTYTPDFGKIR